MSLNGVLHLKILLGGIKFSTVSSIIIFCSCGEGGIYKHPVYRPSPRVHCIQPVYKLSKKTVRYCYLIQKKFIFNIHMVLSYVLQLTSDSMKNWTRSRISGVLGSRFFPRLVRTITLASSGTNSRSLRNSPAAWATARWLEYTSSYTCSQSLSVRMSLWCLQYHMDKVSICEQGKLFTVRYSKIQCVIFNVRLV